MTKIANISQKISKQNQTTLKITITNSHRQIHKTRSYKGTGIDGVIKEDNSTYTVKTTGGSELGPAVSTAWVVDKKTGEIIKTYDVSTPQQKAQYQKKNEEMRKKVKEFDKMHEQTKKQNNSGQDSQQNEEEASQENTENVENQ